ncbi:hypothetical protein G6F37_012610 [Rhizopus arrhizus]|nr:hypothetical protein G6F38_012610 [Rhizopus arrhizus]KAG1142576.1 hypothetical protein G6F37_012610 [Rhizopus arrhizus]
MRVICARAMEGLILVNRRDGLLVNCAEVYSRYPTLDAHHEQTKIKRYQSLNITLPHPTTKYPNVELFIVEKDNSLKLELDTKTMNVLITSSIRIDKNQPPAVGPSSTNRFSVNKDIIIFIRRSFIEWYGDLRQQGFNDLSICDYIHLTSTCNYDKCGLSSTELPLIFFLDHVPSSQTICARGLLRSGHLPTTTLVRTRIQMQK